MLWVHHAYRILTYEITQTRSSNAHPFGCFPQSTPNAPIKQRRCVSNIYGMSPFAWLLGPHPYTTKEMCVKHLCPCLHGPCDQAPIQQRRCVSNIYVSISMAPGTTPLYNKGDVCQTFMSPFAWLLGPHPYTTKEVCVKRLCPCLHGPCDQAPIQQRRCVSNIYVSISMAPGTTPLYNKGRCVSNIYVPVCMAPGTRPLYNKGDMC